MGNAKAGNCCMCDSEQVVAKAVRAQYEVVYCADCYRRYACDDLTPKDMEDPQGETLERVEARKYRLMKEIRNENDAEKAASHGGYHEYDAARYVLSAKRLNGSWLF